MATINAPIESFDVKSYDNTPIRVYKAGKGYHRWLLTPGLGTPVSCWKYLFEWFQEKMTIVTWEPRGCYDSGVPDNLSRLGVDDHTEDAFAILERIGWDEGTFVTGGWSMGIEIGLEIFDRAPERISALTLINGAYEHVLKTAFDIVPKADIGMRALANIAAIASPLFAPASRFLLGQPWAIEILKRMGIVSANEEFFGEVIKDFRSLDFATYFKMILETDKHSARHILPKVNVPTLITAGDADKMTPLSVSRQMHDVIVGSEFFIIPNGTHYTTIEYPEIVNLKLEQFFRENVFGDDWDE